ncbi:hypothetical protein [Spirosoma flavum]|uniref:DUF2357 domain-containing protein n=1 Tax=Spirosoma flavum TaxID=2048557 RepID=A0ABW6ARL8_9BACT
MIDGIRTDRAAVDDQALIKRLNISIPFSSTYSDIRYDQPLSPANYKGMYLVGKPRGNELGRYWIQLRGSLIKVANDGLHNSDVKDPYELLYALDDLITTLRIDPFKTLLNGLELSATIPLDDPRQVCSRIVSYLNHPPNLSMIDRDGLRLPYAEVEAGQHTLKLYAPREGALRVEVKVNKMQYLGNNRPATFVDLVQPRYAASMAAKLLLAFNKIIWKIPKLNLNDLTPIDRELYQNGRVYEYWQVRRQDYKDDTEFKRTEKQRSREREAYNELVRRYWVNEAPDEVERRLQQQLNNNIELMQTQLYQTLLDICLNRWQYVGNLPGAIRLPNHLKLPPLSEIYRLYLGKYSTRYINSHAFRIAKLTGAKNPTIDLFNPSEGIVDSSFERKWINSQQSVYRPNPRSERKPFANELVRLKKAINAPGGLHWSLAELTPLLSTNTQLVLANTGQVAEGLMYERSAETGRPMPISLFPN